MHNLTELYQELILDHNARPRHFGTLAHKTHEALGHNPLCGDALTLALEITATHNGSNNKNHDNDIIKDIAFQGHGCAISKASASLLCEKLKGMSVAEAKKLFELFHATLTQTSEQTTEQTNFSELGKLEALVGVKQFPMRVKCATLAFHTFMAALHHATTPVSTETVQQP